MTIYCGMLPCANFRINHTIITRERYQRLLLKFLCVPQCRIGNNFCLSNHKFCFYIYINNNIPKYLYGIHVMQA